MSKENLQPVVAVSDESGHWYVLPAYLESDFHKDGENEDFVDRGDFDNKYGHYRTGGDLNLVQLYAEIK